MSERTERLRNGTLRYRTGGSYDGKADRDLVIKLFRNEDLSEEELGRLEELELEQGDA